MNELTQKNAELGKFLFCERYTLQPVKNSLYIEQGQDLKRGAVVDVNGVLVGTNSLMPYAVLENDCDTRAKGAFASVFVKGEFNFDKLFFADGLRDEDIDNIVYEGNKIGIVIKPYNYSSGFVPKGESLEERVGDIEETIPDDTSVNNKLVNESGVAKKLEMLEIAILSNIPPAANTLRFYFSKKEYNPNVAGVGSNGTWKNVTTFEANVWDWTSSSVSFSEAFYNAFTSEDNLVSVIAAGNCSSVTSMFRMFRGCTSLVSCCLFDSSSVTTIAAAFFGCTKLKEIPQFDTSSVIIAEYAFNQCRMLKVIPLLDTSAMTNVDSIFSGCSNVESGALALYTKMSTQTNPPAINTDAFLNCGANTTTGAAELAQIPESWGGTAAG